MWMYFKYCSILMLQLYPRLKQRLVWFSVFRCDRSDGYGGVFLLVTHLQVVRVCMPVAAIYLE